jgi:hypothetical protein
MGFVNYGFLNFWEICCFFYITTDAGLLVNLFFVIFGLSHFLGLFSLSYTIDGMRNCYYPASSIARTARPHWFYGTKSASDVGDIDEWVCLTFSLVWTLSLVFPRLACLCLGIRFLPFSSVYAPLISVVVPSGFAYLYGSWGLKTGGVAFFNYSNGPSDSTLIVLKSACGN